MPLVLQLRNLNGPNIKTKMRRKKKKTTAVTPAPRAGENVSRSARTVKALIKTLFLVCI